MNTKIITKISAIILCTIMVCALFTSCTSTGGGTSQTSGNTASNANNAENTDTDGKMNPPAWFVGKWSDGNESEDMEITAHNVIVSNGNLDFTRQIDSDRIQVQETNDGDAYRLDYEAGGMSIAYIFEKQSDGTVKRTVSIAGAETSGIFTKK